MKQYSISMSNFLENFFLHADDNCMVQDILTSTFLKNIQPNF